MSTTSVFTPVCVSKLSGTKHVQVYHGGPFVIPKANGLQKSADMESICLAIVNTMANFYNVQSPEDYAHYVKNIAPGMLSKVRGHVAEEQPILMVVLASQLSQYEGGPREDDLTRLDELCKQISTIYNPGAKVTVVMDGLIYNGMLLGLKC
jgi:Pyoverdine/dityrosine biosynthesis protein